MFRCVSPRHGHKREKKIGGKVSWLEENTLETRPVKTIELMKTPKDNRCAKLEHTQKAIYWMGRKSGNAKRK
jgi:hypothetical protein